MKYHRQLKGFPYNTVLPLSERAIAISTSNPVSMRHEILFFLERQICLLGINEVYIAPERARAFYCRPLIIAIAITSGRAIF